MIENDTTKLKDPDSEVNDEISRVDDELSFTNDLVTFIERMISLNILLSIFKQPPLNIWGVPDDKLQDPTYFIATYFDTKDTTRAL